MRKVNIKNWLLILGTISLIAACNKKEDAIPKVGFSSFVIKSGVNAGVTSDIAGVITDDNIVVKIPAAADITQLIPSFELSDPQTIVYVGGVAQENGVSKQDFSNPVEYTLTGRQGSKSYTVTATKTASFTKFGFMADDNSGVVFRDFNGTIAGLNVTVLVPVGTDVTKLKASFETTAGATVKVNGTAQQSGTTVQDFTNPVVFQVSDAETPTPASFTVTVGFLTAPVWQTIGAKGFIQETAVAGSVKMVINPVTNLPYITFQLAKDAAGTSLTDPYKKVVVYKYDGTAWSAVGSASGVSETRAVDPVIAFDKNGVLYLAYRDYDGETVDQQKLTVKKFTNNAWELVGAKQFTPVKTENPSIIIDDNNVLWAAVTQQDANTGAGMERRQLFFMRFENNAWVMRPFPTKLLGSSTNLINKHGKLYLGMYDRTNGAQRLSAFEYVNNQWAGLGAPEFLAGDKIGRALAKMAVADDGSKYMAYHNATLASAKINFVMKFNGTSWDVLGDEITIGTADENFDLTVHPDGTVYFVYNMSDGVYLNVFDKKTNNWKQAQKLYDEPANCIDIKVSDEGIPYLAVALKSDNKIEVKKLDIPQ